MLFKNAFIYRFTRPVPWSVEELETALDEHRFSPCQPNDSFRLGWVAPAPGISDETVYSNGRYALIALNKEEKILPSSVVNDEVRKRSAVFEEKEQRPLRKQEKQELKEQVLSVLMPKAFSKNKRTLAYLDLTSGLLVLDVSSATKADEFTASLRQATGTLPIQFLKLKDAPSPHFSDWVNKNNCPSPFELGDQCDLGTDDESNTVIRCKGTESLTEAIGSHIDAGMSVTQIALSWDQKISFLLNEELLIKRIKFLDTLQDNLEQTDADEAEQFAASFTLLTLELGNLLDAITTVLGGEDRSAIVQ